MTSNFWFQFSIRRNIAGNQKPQVNGQGYIFSYSPDKEFKDNLAADQTWRRNLPPVHVIIKYQQKSQMKCVSHKLN